MPRRLTDISKDKTKVDKACSKEFDSDLCNLWKQIIDKLIVYIK